jgi:predicted enzyme related to lactoylglutathione lyase
MTPILKLMPILALCAALAPTPSPAEPAGRITGLGGVFFKSKDPKVLMAWYRDVLGIKVEPWGGALMRYDAPGHPPAVILNAMPEATDYMGDNSGPASARFMLNFAVDDLSAFLARLKAKGVTVLKRDDSDPSGKFAWIVDPDGTRIELWEPKAAAPR